MGTQIKDFFWGLFSTADWPARWHCGTWSNFHGWLYIISDLFIWAAYFAIPVLLIKMVTRRKDIPFPRVFWLFIAFIILCGTTHLIDAIIFWWPAYRLSALIRLFTAVVSIFTVYALYRAIPLVMSLRTVNDLEREINERKLIEKKLAASEFLLKEAGRLGRLGGWEHDPVAGKSTWSSAVYDIFEVPETFDIKNSEPLMFFKEPYQQQLRDKISAAYVTGEGWDLELQMTTARNNTIWVRSCGECFYNEETKSASLRGVLMDIDKYKSTEMDLNHSHELLSQSHQQLKTFTHILSHNIRNHASNITLLSTLVEPEMLDENNGELFDKMVKVSRNLNATLDDLAEAIKIRETPITSETLSFQETALKVMEILAQEIQDTAASIKFDFEAETVMFPALYLESILLNLLSNAIKYRKETESPCISVRTFINTENKIILECRDNGLGINMNLHSNKIFGLYKTFHSNKEAHGVGLFLVKTQLESQGGSISVNSEERVGTTFKISFA